MTPNVIVRHRLGEARIKRGGIAPSSVGKSSMMARYRKRDQPTEHSLVRGCVPAHGNLSACRAVIGARRSATDVLLILIGALSNVVQ